MALSLNSVFEVRGASGSDTNGGGFVTGAAGFDYSQQGAKNSGSSDKSVTDGVTAGSTTVTSATANFGTTVVGNIIYIAGGTGSITGGWYQVTARGSATSITVDRSTGLTTGTGVTLNIGGALASVQAALTLMAVQGMQTWIKADGTYSIATGLTVPTGGTAARMAVRGYGTTRGDGSQATIEATAGITLLTAGIQGWTWENLIFDGNSVASTNGVNASLTTGSQNFYSCVFKRMAGYGLNATADSSLVYIMMDHCEVTACGGTAGINVNSCVLSLYRCNVHDNTVPGAIIGSSSFLMATVVKCIFSNNSGSTSDGLQCAVPMLLVEGNVFYQNGRDGLRSTATVVRGFGPICNNIFSTNTGNGLNLTSGSSGLVINAVHHNAYYDNGTAASGVAVDATSVTLTADPFTSAGTDFTLNATAGGGTACKAVGAIGTLSGASGTGYEDLGVFQHPDPAGGGGILVHPGMTGGMHG